ncbi:helix-turn-helix domain-containing protein [Paenibacillus odorifer]|uniref:helix-turn-helix domain-containing protein n=2 Tax=Paenibacillus TaxID=44249 RepID=UPI00068F5AA3|nr:helix-turn-helix transcriptional regulator [Paenibacillus odorifer]
MYGTVIRRTIKTGKENLELTQLDVMNLTKNRIHNKTLIGYESGRNQPDFDTLNYLCDIYNVSADWILGRTKIKRNNDKVKDHGIRQSVFDGEYPVVDLTDLLSGSTALSYNRRN